jgi:ADP-ribosylglycohydrolase
MLKCYAISTVFILLFSTACDVDPKDKPDASEDVLPALPLTETALKDKVLGMMVGSAIGDAMGAPTEMWPRKAIDEVYGWVDRLDTMMRDVSPEGIWVPNLPAGGTTDDTRWKQLIADYLISAAGSLPNPKGLAQHILDRHSEYFKERMKIDPEDSVGMAENFLRKAWLDEWAKVSAPFVRGDYSEYNIRLSTFYGGEMVCAGLLYSPVIGVLFAGNPEKAYLLAFDLAIFDLGYARDISALSAAMTAAAMHPDATPHTVLQVINDIDPHRYKESRLVGRTAHRILDLAQSIVEEVRNSSGSIPTEKSIRQPPTKEEMKEAFLLLDRHLQDMPFHAGEIFLQVLTALILTEFDFELSLQFLVNYGRDNDTTAAIAGAILGAYWGIEKLPEKMYKHTINVNVSHLDLDIEKVSEELTEKIMSSYRIRPFH